SSLFPRTTKCSSARTPSTCSTPEERFPSPSGPPTSGGSATWHARSPSSTWRRLPTLLFEIGCEELPASACEEALRQMRESWVPVFGGTVYATPRRLVLHSAEAPEREADEGVQ